MHRQSEDASRNCALRDRVSAQSTASLTTEFIDTGLALQAQAQLLEALLDYQPAQHVTRWSRDISRAGRYLLEPGSVAPADEPPYRQLRMLFLADQPSDLPAH